MESVPSLRSVSFPPPMGLYDDLPEAKGDPTAEASAAAPSVPAALAPAVRRMAAASASAAKHQPPRPATTAAAAAPAAAAPAPPVPQQQRENTTTNGGGSKHFYYAASFGPFDDDFDEYDPEYPNDFSVLVARREGAAEEARLRAEAAAGVAAAAAAAADRERRIAAAAAEAAAAREREAVEEKRRQQREEEEGRERGREREREREREEAEEEQWPRAGLGSVRPFDSSSAVPVPDSERGMPLAAKMMAKMGWEQGKGLGKQLQGAPLPLVAKKTSARAAVVVPAAAAANPNEEEEKKKRNPTAAPPPPPAAAVPSFSWPSEGDDSSRVVLLTNVAPPGLSEEALGATEDEIGMAATASGGLRSISVFEVVAADDDCPAPSSSRSPFPREALVRVFVEFGDAASAGKFARSVRGQPFFAGNKARGAGGVAARPFSLERLRRGRLAPERGDVP